MKVLYNGRAIIVGLEKTDIGQLPDLEVIGCNCTGLDHLPWDEIERRNIKVISLQGETEFLKNIPSVAELTIWFMLELLRKPHETGRFLGNQLKNRSIGLIGGAGRIGRQVEHLVHAFEAICWIYDIKYPMYQENLEAALQQDIISLHLPLNEETKRMIGEKEFELMKPNAILINTSRPQIVDKEALIKAIKEKSIRYGMDFYDPELEGLALMTNHIGGNTVEATTQTEAFIIQKVNEYLKQNV